MHSVVVTVISALLLSTVQALAQQTATLSSSAPIYLLPDANRTPLATLSVGTRVKVLEEQGEWLRAEFKDSRLGLRVGFIRASSVRIERPATAASPPQHSVSIPVETSVATEVPSTKTMSAAISPAMIQTGSGFNAAAHDPAALSKGRSVALKVPPAILKYDANSMMRGVTIMAAGVSAPTPSMLAVENNLDWQTAGFPSQYQFKLEKVTKKKEFTEVELRATTLWVKLRFESRISNVGAAFNALVVPNAEAYMPEAYRILAAKFFTGPLQAIPPMKQVDLVRFAHITADGTTMRSETYKENLYLVVDLGRDTSVYNDLKFSQATLIAHVLNERLLKTLKAFAEPVKDIQALHGLKLEFEIPHYSFVDTAASAEYYKLQLYAPAEQIRKFSEADITNQEFISNCVVIVDDNRVQVSLTGGAN
jgi:hypothetical protein